MPEDKKRWQECCYFNQYFIPACMYYTTFSKFLAMNFTKRTSLSVPWPNLIITVFGNFKIQLKCYRLPAISLLFFLNKLRISTSKVQRYRTQKGKIGVRTKKSPTFLLFSVFLFVSLFVFSGFVVCFFLHRFFFEAKLYLVFFLIIIQTKKCTETISRISLPP